MRISPLKSSPLGTSMVLVGACLMVLALGAGCNAEGGTGDSPSDNGTSDTNAAGDTVLAGDAPNRGNVDTSGGEVAVVDPCAACDEDESCVDGVCLAPGCPPPAPHGTFAGDMLTDAVVYDCDENPVHVHSLCGANVGYFNLLAGW